jgi:hypothetical protein
MMYHVSRFELGVSPTLVPRIPSSAVTEREGDHHRVCFAPTIKQCLRSIESGSKATTFNVISEFLPRKWSEDLTNPIVYVTRKTLVKAPADKSDFGVTEEHWSLVPIKVQFRAYIDIRKWMYDPDLKNVPLTQDSRLRLNRNEFLLWQSSVRHVLNCLFADDALDSGIT